MKKLRQWLVGGWLLGTLLQTGLGFAQTDLPVLDQHDDSLALEISRAGFAFLGQNLHEEWFRELRTHSLPDIEFSVPGLAQVKVSGVKLELAANDLNLSPSTDGLRLAVDISKLQLDMAQITLRGAIWPHPTTVCHQAQITFGNHNPLPVTGRLAMRLTDTHQIELAALGVHFAPEKGQYQAQGPASCMGPLHSGVITRFVMSQVLAHARSHLANTLVSKVTAMVPKIAAKLNAQLAVPHVVAVPDLYLIPGVRMALTFEPHHLYKDQDLLRITLGIGVQVLEESTNGEDLTDVALDTNKSRGPGLLTYGSLGVNPEFINLLLSKLFRDEKRELLLAPSMHPQMAEFLKLSELSYLIPDLKLVGSEAEHARIFVSLKAAPQLMAGADGQSFDLRCPDMELRIQIKKDGWRDYFFINQDLRFNFKPHFVGREMHVTLANPSLHLSGRWADGYTPTDATFNPEMTADILQVILQQLFMSHTPQIFDLPQFAANDLALRLANFRVDEPFLKLDLVPET